MSSFLINSHTVEVKAAISKTSTHFHTCAPPSPPSGLSIRPIYFNLPNGYQSNVSALLVSIILTEQLMLELLTHCDENIPTTSIIEVYFCMGAATSKVNQTELMSWGGAGGEQLKLRSFGAFISRA